MENESTPRGETKHFETSCPSWYRAFFVPRKLWLKTSWLGLAKKVGKTLLTLVQICIKIKNVKITKKHEYIVGGMHDGKQITVDWGQIPEDYCKDDPWTKDLSR